MTYMSIDEALEDHLRKGRLFEMEPTFPGDPHERSLYLTEEVWSLLNSRFEDKNAAVKCEQIQADLQAFAAGELITYCLTPYGARDEFMGLLDSPDDGVWDMRCRDPSPGVRIFGQFVDVDTFVAVTAVPRSQIVSWLPWLPLLDRYNPGWVSAQNRCKRVIGELFQIPNFAPVTGGEISAYLSSNYYP